MATDYLPIPKEQKFQFSTSIPVLIEHINYGNHIGHDSLVSLVHEARVRFLKSHQLGEFFDGDIGMILVELCIQYKSEAFHGELLNFQVDIAYVAKTYCEIIYRVQEDASKRLVAEAVTKMAFYDYQKKKIVKAPEIFSNAFPATS